MPALPRYAAHYYLFKPNVEQHDGYAVVIAVSMNGGRPSSCIILM